jgi:SAM-dependent methyltransferase
MFLGQNSIGRRLRLFLGQTSIGRRLRLFLGQTSIGRRLLRAGKSRPFADWKIEKTTLPLEFDPQFYKDCHADLSSFTDSQLVLHWNDYGQHEGRLGSPGAMREPLLEFVKSQPSVLEIGPFCKPCVRGPHVKYFDILDRDALTKRALEIGYSTEPAPYIDYVSTVGDLSVVTAEFSAVLSSHCIEHQPDLVRHLQAVGRILSEGGRYFLFIPDKNYCFDHFIAASNLADIVNAYVEVRKVHTLASVVEHRALTTHNDPARHWVGDHADPGFDDSVPQRISHAIAEYEAAQGSYIDVHAWQFTPTSFRKAVETLSQLKFINLEVERIYATPRGHNEFTAVLRKVTT